MAENKGSKTQSAEETPKAPHEAFRGVAERAQEFNERILESAQKTVQEPLEQHGQETLRRYVDWLNNVAEEQRKFASAPEVKELGGVGAMLSAQADFTGEFAKSLGNFANPPKK